MFVGLFSSPHRGNKCQREKGKGGGREGEYRGKREYKCSDHRKNKKSREKPLKRGEFWCLNYKML